jgi:outer membrane biosynthesis protein TonB
MFDTFVAARARNPRTRWVAIAMAVSTVGYLLGAIALVVYSFWQIDRVTPKYVPVSLRGIPGLPGPPAAAPKRPASPTAAKRPATPVRVASLHQPVAAATAPAPTELGDGSGDGTVDGTGDGSGGGTFGDCPDCAPTGTSAPIDTAPPAAAAVTPPAPAAPKIVAPAVVEAQRVSGRAQIDPPPEFYRDVRPGAKVTVPVKLCLSDRGEPTSIDLARSSGSAAYDAKIEEEMGRWRYRPYRVGGQAVPVCTVVTFVILVD